MLLFWNPVTTVAGMPVRRMAARSARRAWCRRPGGGRRRGRGPEQSGQSRGGHVLGELAVVDREVGVPVVLFGQGDQQLVEQRVGQTGNLYVRSGVQVPALAVVVEEAGGLATGRGPDTDDSMGVGDARWCPTAGGEGGDGYLEGERVDIEGVGGVDAGHAGQGAAGVGLLERSEVPEVEDGAQVDVEAFGPLPGEHRKSDDALVVRQGRVTRLAA